MLNTRNKGLNELLVLADNLHRPTYNSIFVGGGWYLYFSASLKYVPISHRLTLVLSTTTSSSPLNKNKYLKYIFLCNLGQY